MKALEVECAPAFTGLQLAERSLQIEIFANWRSKFAADIQQASSFDAKNFERAVQLLRPVGEECESS